MESINIKNFKRVKLQNLKIKYYLQILSLLVIIIAIGAFLRIHNISQYLFYPDSYQNLILVENIKQTGKVVSTLGENGIVYPPFFMWSRPIYPIFILIISSIITSVVKAAALVSLFCGILSIIFAFYLIRTIYKSTFMGLIGALITAISYNHIVWSGFIMSETTGIVLTFIYLSLLFSFLTTDTEVGNWRELLIGLILAVLVFSRYEYILYFISTIYIIIFSGKKPHIKILNICAAFIVSSSIIFTSLFPIKQTFTILIKQSGNLFITGGVLLSISIVFILLKSKLSVKYLFIKLFPYVYFLFLFLGSLMLLIPFINNYTRQIPGIMLFAKTDYLLVVSFLFGSALLIKKNSRLVIFVWTAVIMSEVIYWRINPFMQRYTTHLIPFILIPSVYLFSKLFILINHFSKYKKSVATIILLLTFLYQLRISYNGLHFLDNGLWFTKSYEEVSAKKLQPYLKLDDILIAAFPEPYYYFTHNPTLSLISNYPYVSLNNLPGEQNLIIINDLAMINLFPGFSHFITKYFSDYKIASYRIDVPYRYKTDIDIYNYDYSVNIYRIKKNDLMGKFY